MLFGCPPPKNHVAAATGDPAPVDAGKHCECELDPQSALYRKVNPSLRRRWARRVDGGETGEWMGVDTVWREKGFASMFLDVNKLIDVT